MAPSVYIDLDHDLEPGKFQTSTKTLIWREVDKKVVEKEEEGVIGNCGEVYFYHDFGLSSAILACYNNHWVLRTSPDDWWNVILRNVAQAVDDNGDKEGVRDFFVAHEGKKEISIIVTSLKSVDYSWLFDQISAAIRANIKTPASADIAQVTQTDTSNITQADFTSSSAVQ